MGRRKGKNSPKRLLLCALAAALLLSLIPGAGAAGAAEVCLSSQTLKVNGRQVRCTAYNIDGSNYFRLRDLAALLSDTGSRFGVDYDEAAQAVLIATGEAYVPPEGEPEAEEDLSGTARPTRQRIFVDGEEQTELSVWNIGGEEGSNYFKLRELGELLGFWVNYDEESRTVLVRSRFEPGMARLGETEDAGREYLDRIVFLGDSTTYGIGWYYRHGYPDLCPPAQIWTPSNGTMTLAYYESARILFPATGEKLPIADCARKARPDILIVTLGTNGLSLLDEAGFREKYRSLVLEVREASPNTEIIINSIYPVADSWEGQSYINNKKIDAANLWAEAAAEELGCRFLYSHEALEADGRLPENRQNGDGLHLNGEAFGQVMAYIRTHALPEA